jgi:hypothetical protein
VYINSDQAEDLKMLLALGFANETCVPLVLSNDSFDVGYKILDALSWIWLLIAVFWTLVSSANTLNIACSIIGARLCINYSNSAHIDNSSYCDGRC